MGTRKDKPTSSKPKDGASIAPRPARLQLVVIDVKPVKEPTVRKVHTSALAARLEAMADELDQQILALAKL